MSFPLRTAFIVSHKFGYEKMGLSRGQPGLQSEFQDSQGYTERNPDLKKKQKTPSKQTNKEGHM